jgi:AraC-like DNA-binding protein
VAAMPTDLFDTPQPTPSEHSEDGTRHVEWVLTVAQSDASASPDDEVAISWRRSANVHHVDPESGEAPRIVTSCELKDLREPLAKLIVDARDEIDRLYGIVRHANYTVLLCNGRGVAVDHRGNEAEADQFKYWGTWLGGVWAEQVEGTNGIGTCIADERPITVHRTQHFRARHATLSCSGAPIFDSDGKLIAVLDVSSIDPQLSEHSHALTGGLTETFARAIEERCFRERFRGEWILSVGASDGEGPGMLFAADRDQRIVGADRNARSLLARENRSLEDGVGLWALFKADPALFRHKDRGDIVSRLIVAGTGEIRPVLVTPPEMSSGAWPATARWHTRPRLVVIGDLPASPPPPARGGLPPGALRRVKEYIAANLDKSIDLPTLAGTAGFSVFHFARAFKQTEGVTPHVYLLEQRLQRARELLTGADLPLSEIARATGFSDQGHLARHFRQRVGMSPSMFRWSKR